MRGSYLYDPVDVDDDFGLIIKTCPDRSIFRLLSGSMLVAGRSDAGIDESQKSKFESRKRNLKF